MASTRPTSRAGIVTACRSSCGREEARPARAEARCARPSAPPAAPLRRSRSTLQRADFKRLGVFGDWDHPYLTMDPRYEAQQIRALGNIIHNGHLYSGVKPVHWCLDCRSALAEAEVEYEEQTSPAIDVAFRVVDVADFARRIGLAAGDSGRVPADVVIWTTTPWTLPANEAVALREEFRYVLVRGRARAASATRLLLAADLLDACLQALRHDVRQTVLADTPRASALEGLKLQHPWLDRAGAGHPRRARDARCRHRRGAYRARRTARRTSRSASATGCRSSIRSATTAAFCPSTPLVAGLRVDEANAVIIEALESAGGCCTRSRCAHSYPHCWRHKTPVIFPRHAAVVHQHGRRGTCASTRCATSRRCTGRRPGASSASPA